MTAPPSPPGGFVRPATAADASAIAGVQVTSWRAAYGGSALDGLVTALDERTAATAWRQSIESPPGPGYLVLAAVADAVVVGFAAVAPCPDPDRGPATGELVALEVHASHRGRGHGSRLLAAVAETSSNAGYTELVSWIGETETERGSFLHGAGLVADGATRVRTRPAADAATEIHWPEIRLVCTLPARPA